VIFNKSVTKAAVSFVLLIIAFCPALAWAELETVTATGDTNSTQQLEQQLQPAAKPSDELVTIPSITAKIRHGDFDAAAELLYNRHRQIDPAAARLDRIIAEFQAITQRRQAQRKAAYQEHLAELESLSVKKDCNDINDISSIISAVAKTSAYADDQQKKQLLEKEITKSAVQKMLQKSAEHQAKGQWLEALLYYRQLSNLYPDNTEYADQAEELTQKALIQASLQNNACETWQQRHANIDKKIFIWAIKILHFQYISVINYREMAVKAIESCRLLAEVTLFADDWETQFPGPEPNMVAAFTSQLDRIIDDVNTSAAGDSRDKFIAVFKKVLKLNTATAKLPEQVLIAQFSQAALATLDPHTNIVWPVQVAEFSKNMTQEFTGIGIEITNRNGPLEIVSLLPGTPAYNSCLDAGDIIEEVDDLPTKDMPIGCAVEKITGPTGTKVTLTIRRKDAEESEKITITRAKIVVPTLRGWTRDSKGQWLYIIDPNSHIGYVRVTNFSANTARDLQRVLRKLELESSLQGLILDLRYNTGGYLEAAVDVADKFLAEGLIVSTRPRRGGFPTWLAAHKKELILITPWWF